MSTDNTASNVFKRAERIGPTDPRYRGVVEKRFNKRFQACPDYVHLVHSTDQVVTAVMDAVADGRRLVVTSGGHCLEGFVADPDGRVIVDVSPMRRVYYDAGRRAVAVEAGATVGETFQQLYEQWRVVLPLAEYPGVGMGGHVVGGGFGFLSRRLGLAADYLYAVEVVTVDRSGHARAVVATQEPSDPHHDLWWAHTGGGGGNFGIVTRYWFRARGANGNDASALLPAAPRTVTTFEAEWNWSDIDRARFRQLLRNYGEWCEQHGSADSPNVSLWNLLQVHVQALGKIFIRGLVTDMDSGGSQIEEHLATLADGVMPLRELDVTSMSWLEFALNPFPKLFGMPPGGVSVKVKDALLKRRFSDVQADAVFNHMTSSGAPMGGMLGLATYGGRINTVAPATTAAAQRDAIIATACNAGWLDAADAPANLEWVRALYLDLFAESGGVPVPGEAYDGALINHPDTDLADPALNTSDVPWHTLYYQENYPRLQQVKVKWDPRDVFHHALSIRPD